MSNRRYKSVDDGRSSLKLPPISYSNNRIQAYSFQHLPNSHNTLTDSLDDLTDFLHTNGLLSSAWKKNAANEGSSLKVQNSHLARLVREQDDVIALQKQEIKIYRKFITKKCGINLTPIVSQKSKVTNAR